jgi:hypothetical protein
MHTVLSFIPCAEAHFFVSLGILFRATSMGCRAKNVTRVYRSAIQRGTVTTWPRRTPMEKFVGKEVGFRKYIQAVLGRIRGLQGILF